MLAVLTLALLTIAPHSELVRMFDYDRAARLELQEQGVEQREGVAVHDLSYAGASPGGGRVPAYLVVPPDPEKGPFAAIVFMHGAGGGRSGMLPQALVLARAGAVGLLIDGPLSGARARPGARVSDVTRPEQTRAAMIQTIVDLRRGVDLLRARADVDPQRLGFVGASYGAVIGGILSGVETRIKAYALAVGGASLGDLVRNGTSPMAKQAAKALTPEQLETNLKLLAPLDPVHYVGHAAPAALFFQNGLRDMGIPEASARRYQAAGSEPKRIAWYDAGHGLNAQAFRDRAAWLSEQLSLAPLPATATATEPAQRP
jgi:dienelactone hydrolase